MEFLKLNRLTITWISQIASHIIVFRRFTITVLPNIRYLLDSRNVVSSLVLIWVDSEDKAKIFCFLSKFTHFLFHFLQKQKWLCELIVMTNVLLNLIKWFLVKLFVGWMIKSDLVSQLRIKNIKLRVRGINVLLSVQIVSNVVVNLTINSQTIRRLMSLAFTNLSNIFGTKRNKC